MPLFSGRMALPVGSGAAGRGGRFGKGWRLRGKDEAGGPFVKQIIPCPVDENHHPVAESDEIEQVNDEPEDPGKKAGV